jgi:quercetin dioxygenase-like cupin family protein
VTRRMVVAVCGLGLAASSVGAQNKMASDAKPLIVPAVSAKWVDNPAIKGAQIAVLTGDPKAGAYSALKKLPAGASMGKHTHTAAQTVVVVSGTITLQVDGMGPAQDMTAGSFLAIPGGMVHSADCKAGADCVYFEEQPGASDYKPVEAPKGDAPKK